MIPVAPVREPLHCTAMKRHEIRSSSQCQSTQGCGATDQGSGIAPCPESLHVGTARQGRGGCPRQQGRGPCPSPARTRGAFAHCEAMKHHALKTMSPRQSTQGCGAAQRGRPHARVRGDCTVSPQPPRMRTFGVQGCNALAVGVSGAAARP
jgi:hypothetical protein